MEQATEQIASRAEHFDQDQRVLHVQMGVVFIGHADSAVLLDVGIGVRRRRKVRQMLGRIQMYARIPTAFLHCGCREP